MGAASKLVIALSCAAGLTACAGGPQAARAPAHLYAGGQVAAPAGLLEFCARTLGECDTVVVNGLRGTLPATGGAVSRRGVSTAEVQPASSAGNSMFQVLLAARMAPHQSQTSSRVELTEVAWSELVTLNNQVNRAIRAATDRDIYGVEERWTMPLSDNPGALSVRGDCEDFALEKRARLLAAGWPADALALAVAIVPDVGVHAVLVVQTSRGDFVLDNLQSRPRRVDHRSYVWVSRQVGPGLDQWATASLGVSAVLNLEAPASGRDSFQQHMNAARLEAARLEAARLEAAEARLPGEGGKQRGDGAAPQPRVAPPSEPRRDRRHVGVAMS